MATPRNDSDLDNAVWHALRGRQAEFADSVANSGATRFQSDVGFFGGIERTDPVGWAALAELVGPGGLGILFRGDVGAVPAGWTELERFPGLQLVASQLPPAPELPVVTLGESDVDDMLELTSLTEPGPFLRRTVQLGRYIGLRRNGQLIAMAGERLKVPGWTEISAVCTHPDARREGLGAALTLRMAEEIRRTGDEAFLHVIALNENALRLYRALGFEVRRPVDAIVAQWQRPENAESNPRPGE